MVSTSRTVGTGCGLCRRGLGWVSTSLWKHVSIARQPNDWRHKSVGLPCHGLGLDLLAAVHVRHGTNAQGSAVGGDCECSVGGNCLTQGLASIEGNRCHCGLGNGRCDGTHKSDTRVCCRPCALWHFARAGGKKCQGKVGIGGILCPRLYYRIRYFQCVLARQLYGGREKLSRFSVARGSGPVPRCQGISCRPLHQTILLNLD
mmetsp:Transcript_25825/g.71127  ORF Transcript_25825/g.71127 Transcript_25825/m.71127 type:complete len:203 (-) Transcript_25825:1171-1779(-)